MQVYVYTLSFGSLCAHRSVNPRGNASAYTPAKPETVATAGLAVRPTADLHVTRRRLATCSADNSSSHPRPMPQVRNWLRFSGSIPPMDRPKSQHTND
jgi:hypothetical protein